MSSKTSKNINVALAKLLYSAMFLSLALLFPFLTAQVKAFGIALCPMHIPVLLCGFVCGPTWGLAVGASAPILRSIIFGMPELMPSAVAMGFELATYAFVAGLMYKKMDNNLFIIAIDLITAMVCGRLIWGAVIFILVFFGVPAGDISLNYLWTKTVLESIPGIILQIIAIPLIVDVLKKNKLILN